MTIDPLRELEELRERALREPTYSDVTRMLGDAGINSAWAKFAGSRPSPYASLAVDVGQSGDLDAATASAVSNAVQRATALVVRGLRDPKTESSQIYRGDVDKARLVQRGQVGRHILFEVKRSPSGADHLEVDDQATLTEKAVGEIVQVLPETSADDAALDAILGQRVPMRMAVSELVEVARAAHGLGLHWTLPGAVEITSILSGDQAEVLEDGLRQLQVETSRRQVIGRLDGLRTKRRIFYLEQDDGSEIQGAIDAEKVDSVLASLNERVLATVEVTVTKTAAGRRGREHFRLVNLAVQSQLGG